MSNPLRRFATIAGHNQIRDLVVSAPKPGLYTHLRPMLLYARHPEGAA